MKAPDMHIHTLHSHDSEESMEAYCEKAVALGLPYVCFTDHVDWLSDGSPREKNKKTYHPQAFFASLSKARKQYAGKLHILAGAEFGEPASHRLQLQQIRAYPYDMIMGSIHFLGDMLVDCCEELGWPMERMYQRYWDEMEKTVDLGGFDVIAHMDFPIRKWKELWYHPPQMKRMMKKIVRSGLVLEINTSALRKGESHAWMPGRELLTLYRQAGGTHVTLGSDAHSVADLCAGFVETMELVDDLGLCAGIVKQHVFVPFKDLC